MPNPTIERFAYKLGPEQGSMAYRVWSAGGIGTTRPGLLCAHGISQNSRHFDALAQRLVGDFDIIVPDYPGRGLSDAFADKLNYTHPNYVALFQSFLAARHLNELYWLGTSMGGLTGLFLASLPETPIQKLVLNDIGPVIPKETRQQFVMAAKAGPVRYASLAEAQESMAGVFARFGLNETAMQQAFVQASLRQDADGSWRPDYDFGIFEYALRLPEIGLEDALFWNSWATVRCPVLVLHGVNSTTLTPAIIAEMRRSRPDIEVVDIPNTGHAPHLMSDEQAGLVRRWLLRD